MHRWFAALCLLAFVPVLGACLPQDGLNDSYLRLYAESNPTPDHFYECHGFHCARHDHIELSAAEWQSVRALFNPPAADARDERRQIAQALAQLQRLVGQRTGTAVHQWTRHGGLIDGNPGGDLTQLDCIDESVNSWTYLTMMARDGLLKFHRVGPLSAADSLLFFHFRNTAVLIANADGALFAVDPTLVDETEPPPIFPLALWRERWPPVVPAADRNEPRHGA
ncbi:MAG TPA: hypothetical protein VLX85_06565 [Stellaceae bacterium]|nr:hypothetical protein [Stellaceae bacterium]